MPIKMNERELLIYQSTRQLWVKAIFFVLLVGGLYWLYGIDTSKVNPHGFGRYRALMPFAKPIFITGICMFSIMALACFKKILFNKPSVIINSEGVWQMSDFLITEKFLWSEITQIGTAEFNLNVHGHEHGPIAVIEFHTTKKRGLQRFLVGGKRNSFLINFYQLGVSRVQCARWLKEFERSKELYKEVA